MALTVQQQELAASYASIILSDSGKEVTEEGIKTVLEAAGIDYEVYVPMLFARASAGVDIADLMTKVGGSGAPAGGAAAGGAAAAEVEEEKPVSEEESSDMGGFSLFD